MKLALESEVFRIFVLEYKIYIEKDIETKPKQVKIIRQLSSGFPNKHTG